MKVPFLHHSVLGGKIRKIVVNLLETEILFVAKLVGCGYGLEQITIKIYYPSKFFANSHNTHSTI